ncbi:MAG TPA: Zn-ribbon domain-containing OB-fold protein [Rhodocyclaceae bacterium]|nr:Zn-ribbon domain-containing OB-fold protein [Rhodocyclaceae bacterium]
MYEKPLPIVDPDSAPYWAGTREHKLLLPRCRDCGRHHFYPRALCPHCHSDNLEWVQASGQGSIYSYIICNRPAGPVFKADCPYVVAIIALDEGPRMMTNIVGADPATVRVGQKVTVCFEDVTPEITLPKFKLC